MANSLERSLRDDGLREEGRFDAHYRVWVGDIQRHRAVARNDVPMMFRSGWQDIHQQGGVAPNNSSTSSLVLQNYPCFPGFSKHVHFWVNLTRKIYFHPAELKSIRQTLESSDIHQAVSDTTTSTLLITLPNEIFAMVIDNLGDADLLALGATCRPFFQKVIHTIEKEMLVEEPDWSGLPLVCSNQFTQYLPQGFINDKLTGLYPPQPDVTRPDTDYLSDLEFSLRANFPVVRRRYRNYWSRQTDAVFARGQAEAGETCVPDGPRAEPAYDMYKRCFAGSSTCADANQIWLLRNLDSHEYITCCSCRELHKHVKPKAVFKAQGSMRDQLLTVDQVILMQIAWPLFECRQKYKGDWAGCGLDIVSVEYHEEDQSSDRQDWLDVTDKVMQLAAERKMEADTIPPLQCPPWQKPSSSELPEQWRAIWER